MARGSRIAAAMVVLTLGLSGPSAGAAPVGCTELLGDEVQMGVTSLTEFFPRCIVIDSGETVTWTAFSGRHDPMSWLDTGLCFIASLDRGGSLDAGESWTVPFVFDGVSFSSFGGGYPCQDAVARPRSSDEAVVPFRCAIHPERGQGTLVVRRG